MEHKKIVILGDGKRSDYVIKSAYDIYDLYNMWLSIDDDEPEMTEEIKELCEEIRDATRLLFYHIPAGKYTLDAFELVARKVLDGKIGHKNNGRKDYE